MGVHAPVRNPVQNRPYARSATRATSVSMSFSSRIRLPYPRTFGGSHAAPATAQPAAGGRGRGVVQPRSVTSGCPTSTRYVDSICPVPGPRSRALWGVPGEILFSFLHSSCQFCEHFVEQLL